MYVISLKDIQGDVDKAARVLDELSPSWASTLVDKYRRDLADMKVSDPDKCVLSAVFGDYNDGSFAVANYVNVALFKHDPFACLMRENYLWREAWRLAVERRLDIANQVTSHSD